MNRIFRTVWSGARRALMVASENARSSGGARAGSLVAGLTPLQLVAFMFAFALVALVEILLGTFGALSLAMAGAVTTTPSGVPAAAPAANRPTVGWGRKREPMKTFTNIGAGQTGFSKIPRYPRTVLSMHLDRSGSTTLRDSDITRLELFLGEKSIWGPLSATDLRMTERYIHGEKESGLDAGNDPNMLTLDFTASNVKEIGGEQIGGLDLQALSPGDVRLEVDIAATAVAPQFRGHFVWGPPQGGKFGGLMRKLIKRTYPQAAAGDFYPDVQVRGAILMRQFWKGTLTNNAVVTAFALATEGRANVGNGALTATVPLLTPVGRFRAVCAKAGPAAVFEIMNPKGQVVGCVTSAAGALPVTDAPTFTITDGGTAWAVGDGFQVDVLPSNTDGNINLIEVKKNEDFWFLRTDRMASWEERKYGRSTMAGLFVADYLLDNHSDSVIDTANAATLDYRLNLTQADTVFVIHEVLAQPTFNT